jgi:ABC-type transport system involved in multi-copper enzyme maturation permease subunit
MNAARVRAVVNMDLRFHFTRPLFWILMILLAFSSWGLSSGTMAISTGDSTIGGESRAWLTSEFSVAFLFPLMTFLLYAFFAAVASGMLVPRDEELGVESLLHSMRLTPSEYVWGKFGAVLITFLVVLVSHLLFTMICNHLLPNAEADRIRGPFALVNYLRPAAVMAFPALLFFLGISFLVGESTRRPILVFVTPVTVFLVCIFFLMDWAPTWLDPSINRLLMWIEPSGYRWLNETWLKLDRGVDFYNTTPVGYDLPFLLSRVAYVLVGIGAVGLARRHLERNIRGERAIRLTKKTKGAAPSPESSGDWPTAERSAPVAAIGMRSSSPGFVRTVLDVARFEGRNLRSAPGLYLFVPIILLQTIGTEFFRTGAFDTPLLLTNGVAAVSAMNALTMLVCFLLLFYTVESVLRERNTRLDPILYATPARTAAVLLGKAVANGLVAAVILLASMIGAFIVLLIQGRVAPDPVPFLLVWGLLLVPTFLVWAAFVTAVLAATGNRFTTYGIGLGVMAFTGWKQVRGEMNWVGNWDLWSAATWTDFGRVDPNGMALLMNRLFWLAVMVFLIALTMRIFPRREFDSGRILDRLRSRSLLRTAWRLSPFGLPAIVLGFTLYGQVERGFQGKTAEKHDKEYWGRNLATWVDAETPMIGGVDVELELEPSDRRFSVEGTYALVNHGEEPMRRFPMSVGEHFENVEWTLAGETFEPENWAKLYVFKLDKPLAPEDTILVGFSLDGAFPRGVTKNGGGMSEFILPSGVVLTSFGTSFLPVPWFEEGRGVDEDNETEPKDWEEGFWEGVTPPAFGGGARYPVRTRITGPEEYAYHGVGRRVEETVGEGRRTVVWETDHPVNFFNVVAGKWDVWRGEDVEVYHHPTHTYNVEEIGSTLEAARRWYSEWFYPYPWQDLRINEFPGLAFYAQGFPTNITFSEHIGFLTRNTEEANATFLVTAHETAHQWWGNLLLPGEGPGGNILSEGMAHFSTMLLFGQELGERERIEFCRRIEERYGDQRQVDAEKPLVWIDGSKAGDNTVTYDKGGWVFWMLLDLLGEDAGFAGIRDFIGRYTASVDHPVLQDFLRVMREHAPDPAAFDAFEDQWFLDVVVPEYRISDAAREEDGGAWIVTATVENVGTGRMPVEIAAVAGDRFPEEGEETENPWKESRVRVELGAGEETRVSLTCAFEPERILVDPDARVLMLEREKAEARL